MAEAGALIRIDGSRIVDWGTFFDVFDAAFGFPGFFGRNMNAWIDCMDCLDEPEAGMTAVHVQPGGLVTLVLDHAGDFASRCPEQYAGLVECAAFVNWRRVERGRGAVLALAFHK
jgi:hypothetical protein